MVMSRHISGLEGCNCVILDPDHQGQVRADVEMFVRTQVQQLSLRLHLSSGFQTHFVHPSAEIRRDIPLDRVRHDRAKQEEDSKPSGEAYTSSIQRTSGTIWTNAAAH